MRQREFGHLALQYLPGDEKLARHLLELFGCTLVDNGPDPGNDGFCTVLVNAGDANHADNIFFLGKVSDAQLAIEHALRETLALDSDTPSPLLTTFRERVLVAPESTSHLGIRYRTFDELERTLLAIEEATAPGGLLHGRASLVKYKARPGVDPVADEAIAASPAFTGDERPAFADGWIQCFVRTDLLGFGLLSLGSTFELDFVFDSFFVAPPSFGTKKAATTA
jgi:hypothetical protein